MTYYNVLLRDGPSEGGVVTTIGKDRGPCHGFCLEVDREVPAKWWRGPQTLIDIYKVNYSYAEVSNEYVATYVGTLR